MSPCGNECQRFFSTWQNLWPASKSLPLLFMFMTSGSISLTIPELMYHVSAVDLHQSFDHWTSRPGSCISSWWTPILQSFPFQVHVSAVDGHNARGREFPVWTIDGSQFTGQIPRQVSHLISLVHLDGTLRRRRSVFPSVRTKLTHFTNLCLRYGRKSTFFLILFCKSQHSAIYSKKPWHYSPAEKP